MKRVFIHFLGIFTAMLLLCGAASAEELTAWGSVQGGTAVLCLPGAEGEDFSCQIGNESADIQSITPLGKLETPVETVVLIDNSFSIQKNQRPVIKELLGDLIANRLAGEKYTIATISDQVNYLCSGESDYTELKAIVDGLAFQDQRTQLTDGLYHVLGSLKSSDEGTLRRLLIIADGVDNKQVGYTQNELAALIQKMGYPIYTVGCANNSASATEELQNLFALSRLTPGESYYLPEVEKTMDIVSRVIAWNDSIQLTVALPQEVCDGMAKALRVTDGVGGNIYMAEMKMPLAELQEPKEEPKPTPAPEPEPVPEPEAESAFPVSIVLMSLLVAAAVAVIMILLRRKKMGERIVETPEARSPVLAPANTELLAAGDDSGRTEGIWSSSPATRLVFQNLDIPRHRIEATLDGEILIGRDASACQVILTEPSVARRQCRIFQRGSWIMLENLSQSNITKLNGHMVVEDCELIDGGILQMGRLRMRVEIVQS